MFGPASVHQAQVDPNQFPESTTTPCVARDGADFAALGGKIQEHAVPPSLRVKPGAKHPAWKTQSDYHAEMIYSDLTMATVFYTLIGYYIKAT